MDKIGSMIPPYDGARMEFGRLSLLAWTLAMASLGNLTGDVGQLDKRNHRQDSHNCITLSCFSKITQIIIFQIHKKQPCERNASVKTTLMRIAML